METKQLIPQKPVVSNVDTSETVKLPPSNISKDIDIFNEIGSAFSSIRSLFGFFN